MDGIELIPYESNTDENVNMFYVYAHNGDNLDLVAGIEKVGDGWRAINGTTVYDSAIMAAFADANLSDPSNWTE